jgi:hypothetical protein
VYSRVFSDWVSGKGGAAGLTLHASDKWQHEMMQMRLHSLAYPLLLNEPEYKIPCQFPQETFTPSEDPATATVTPIHDNDSSDSDKQSSPEDPDAAGGSEHDEINPVLEDDENESA